MENNKFVSVIVATYRRDKELERSLDSLSHQEYKNFEVILVDDNDDEQWNSKVCNILNEYKQVNPTMKITYIANHPNIGSAKARNEGIKVSTGEYICFLDDDDIYLPNRINNQLIPMIENDADYSITDLELYNEEGKLVDKRIRSYIKETDTTSLLKYHFLYHMTGTDCLMFKKVYLEKIRMFDPIDVGDEFYLMTKAIENEGKFTYVNTCDVKAYVHSSTDGLSSGQSKIQGENNLYEYKKKYFNTLNSEDIKYIKVRHYFVNAYAYLRMKSYFKCLYALCEALIVSPRFFVRIYIEHKK